MRILLDTHIFLWFISGDAQLSTNVRDAIRNPRISNDPEVVWVKLSDLQHQSRIGWVAY